LAVETSVKTIELKTRVAPDGTVTVPVGAPEAGRPVTVTVAPAPDESSLINGLPTEEWKALFERTCGSIGDSSFERPLQRPYAHRTPFD
jgi:hypothetical protein